jgi:hypothetical protein
MTLHEIYFQFAPSDPFDAFEIHPVRNISQDPEQTEYETCEDIEAELWSVYVHYIPTDKIVGLECIADCKTKTEAEAIAGFLEKLCKLYKGE